MNRAAASLMNLLCTVLSVVVVDDLLDLRDCSCTQSGQGGSPFDRSFERAVVKTGTKHSQQAFSFFTESFLRVGLVPCFATLMIRHSTNAPGRALPSVPASRLRRASARLRLALRQISAYHPSTVN